MVLDPITALSLAGTVVQFVDFGSKLLTHGLTLMHREGGPMFDVVGELEMTTAYLSDLSTKLSQPSSAATPSTTHQEPMDRLCQASISIAGELLGKIRRLKVEGKNRKWRCLMEAIRWAWNEDALKDLVSRLSKLREMVELHVLVALREKIDIVSLQHSKRFDKLDFDTQRIVTALIGTQQVISNQIKVQDDLSAELKDQTRAVTQMMSRLEPLFVAHELADDRARQLHGKSQENVDSEPETYKLADIVKESDDWLKDIWDDESQTRETVNDFILQKFYFQSMSDRKDGVSDRHPNTFKWILEEPKHREDEPPWSNFAKWLQNGKNIYWINGKAASGKSTLMRYLCEYRRTLDLLKTWARPEAPILAYHFFWNSGTVEQRSHEGLLKTILYSVLTHHKQLIPILLPVKYARKYAEIAAPLVGKASTMMLKGQPSEIEGNDTSIREPSALIDSDMSSVVRIPWESQEKLDGSTTSATNEIWTLKDLMQLFKRLIQQREIPIKLCLFIDGLDEYDGCYEELVDFLQLITTSIQVKACVASRTLRPFEEAFGSGHTLRLQDWTCCDIELYVHDHLSQHPKFSQLTREEPSRAPELVKEIVRKANGVFLWVKLVVQSLRKGLRNRDSIKDLQRRLHLLPEDLEQLYNHIFANIDEFYKAQASEYFQLVRSARRQRSELNDNTEALTLVELAFAVDDDHELAVKAELKRPSPNWLKSRCDLTQTRLQVRCLGLLEIHRSREIEKWQVGYFNKVQYLHRTTRDWLERPEVWKNIVAQTERTDFDPNLSLLRACVLQIKWGLHQSVSSETILNNAASYARKFERSTDQAPTELLDQLFYAMKAKSYAYSSKSCLSLGSKYRLKAYLRQKHSAILKTCKERPPLKCVLFEHPDGLEFAEQREIVNLLLKNGADPNDSSEGGTPWEELLVSTYNGRREFCTQDRFSTIRLFLKHGANINKMITIDGNPMKVAFILTTVFGPSCLDGIQREQELKNQLIQEQINSTEVSSTSLPKRGLSRNPWRAYMEQADQG